MVNNTVLKFTAFARGANFNFLTLVMHCYPRPLNFIAVLRW